MHVEFLVGAASGAVARFAVLLALASLFPGCAALTLNGCRRLGPCGELVVGACDGQLTCVGPRGRVVHSEPYRPGVSPCARCRSPQDEADEVAAPASVTVSASRPVLVACRP